ncbi:nuclease A inhibitor family protein [Microcoleus sp. MOSTC5]
MQVYQVGSVEIDAYIVGVTPGGGLRGCLRNWWRLDCNRHGEL